MTDSQICQWMQIIKSNHSNFKKVNSLVFSVIINKSRNEINKKKPTIFLIKIQVYKENTHEHTFHGFGTCTLNVL